jgi:hypothetical protein
MGEIRSTLDIIMEKAKDVEVTEEDKAVFMQREAEGKVRGLLQKYQDNFLDVQRLQEEMDALGPDGRETAVAALRRECLERLTLEGDNQRLLDILSRVAGMDMAPVETLLSGYREDLKTKRAAREAALREGLRDQGISGPAVVPNLKADPTWISEADETRDRFHRQVADLHMDA